MVAQPFHPETGSIDPIQLLRAAADPIRLRVINILCDGDELPCSALADRIGVPLPTMSHHLKLLREAGITRNRKAGTTRWTSLRRDDLDAAFPGLTVQLAALAARGADPATR